MTQTAASEQAIPRQPKRRSIRADQCDCRIGDGEYQARQKQRARRGQERASPPALRAGDSEQQRQAQASCGAAGESAHHAPSAGTGKICCRTQGRQVNEKEQNQKLDHGETSGTGRAHRWHGMEQTHRMPAAMKTGLRTRHGSGPSIRDAPRGGRSQLKSALRPERWSTGNFTFVYTQIGPRRTSGATWEWVRWPNGRRSITI